MRVGVIRNPQSHANRKKGEVAPPRSDILFAQPDAPGDVAAEVMAFAQAGCEIDLDHLPLEEDWARGSMSESSSGTSVSTDVLDNAYHLAKERVLANFEEEYVTRLVARASGNVSRAARLASVDRTTLYRLLQRHGYRRDASDASLLR